MDRIGKIAMKIAGWAEDMGGSYSRVPTLNAWDYTKHGRAQYKVRTTKGNYSIDPIPGGVKLVFNGEEIGSFGDAREAVQAARNHFLGKIVARVAAGKTVDRMISELKSKFRMTWVKDGAEFDGSGAVLWSGEGCYIFVRGEKVEAFDYYSEDHSTYEFGVHKALVGWAKANGLTWQANDPGTFLAYES